MTWTKVAKPGAQTWTDSHPQGKQQYDESTIQYDDPNTFYDGIDPDQWTMVAKPTGGTTITIRVGMATGLIMPPTYAVERTINSSNWIKVPKPN